MESELSLNTAAVAAAVIDWTSYTLCWENWTPAQSIFTDFLLHHTALRKGNFRKDTFAQSDYCGEHLIFPTVLGEAFKTISLKLTKSVVKKGRNSFTLITPWGLLLTCLSFCCVSLINLTSRCAFVQRYLAERLFHIKSENLCGSENDVLRRKDHRSTSCLVIRLF